MKVNNVTPITFGYSKKSQKILEEKMLNEVEDEYLASAILQHANTCNQMEDALKERKRRNLPEDRENLDIYTDMFTSAKENLYYELALYTEPAIYNDYLENEYTYYSNSFKRCKKADTQDWRWCILSRMEGINNDLGKTKEDLRTELTKKEMELEEVKKNLEMEIARKEKELEDVRRGEIENYLNKTILNDKPQPKNPKMQIPPGSLTGTKNESEECAGITLLKKNAFTPDGFSDIMGMEDLKRDLKEEIIDPVNNPEQAKIDSKEYGREPATSVLLYGPPGCGKTYIIQALAQEIEAPVYAMDAGNIGSKYINQTSVNIKKSFDFLKNMAYNCEGPVILFIDEMDALTFNRNGGTNEENLKQVATLLKEIEDAQKENVIIVGATNKYDLVDPAVKRRFQMKRFVGTPNKDQRAQQVRNNLKNKTKAQLLLEDDKAIDEVAGMLDGYSYHSINLISNEASRNALQRNRANISVSDYKKAVEETNEEKPEENSYKTKSKRNPIGFSQSE